MKVAKVLHGTHKGKWAVAGDAGWVGPEGEVIVVEAVQARTKFFKDVAEAKVAGFSPTAAHSKVISTWGIQVPQAPAAPGAK